MTSKLTGKARRLKRRKEVEKLLLSGAPSGRAIARRLQEPQATISRDIKAIFKEWANDVAPEDRRKWRIREMKDLEQMERPWVLASLGYREGQPISEQERDFKLAEKACRRRIAIKERRAKILGLDSTTIDVRDITPADVLEAAKHLDKKE